MNLSTTDSDDQHRPTDSLQLADGGFNADTEVITTDGAVRVSELSPGDRVCALDLSTRVMRWKPLMAVTQTTFEDDVIALEGKRFDFRVAPGHQVPFETKAYSTARHQRAGDLTDRQWYKFVNEWTAYPGPGLELVDLTDYLDEYEICVASEDHGHTFRAALPAGCEPSRRNSHIGYFFDAETFKRYQQEIETIADDVRIHARKNHHRHPYRFDGDDFVQLIGWYVTEGSVYWKTTKDTASVQIAQRSPTHRPTIHTLLNRMGLRNYSSEWGYRFTSVLIGGLLEEWCGRGSKNKRLPAFVRDLSPNQQRLLLETLIHGDGSENGTYYTSSDRLANDLFTLMVEQGVKPRYGRRDQMWRVFVNRTNDGFTADHVSRREPTQDRYQLTVKDDPTVMAGRNGKFQWTGVSRVA